MALSPEGLSGNQLVFTVSFTDFSQGIYIAEIALNPTITTDALPTLTRGTFASLQFTAVSGTPPYAWAVVDGTLPAGMTFHPDGTLEGTPTEAGLFPLTVRVTDSANAIDEKVFLLEVIVPPTTESFTLDFEDGLLPAAHGWRMRTNLCGDPTNDVHEIVSYGTNQVLRMSGDDCFKWFLDLTSLVDPAHDWVFSADMRRVAGGVGPGDQVIERFIYGEGTSSGLVGHTAVLGEWVNVRMEMDHSINKVRWFVTGQEGLKFSAIVDLEDFLPLEGLNPYHPSLNGIAFGHANIGSESVQVEFDNIVFAVRIDTDADGLMDDEEGMLGTNPNDPDTDDDGLLDGTEVEAAMGSGCPNPLDVDADGDTLLDGAEVTAGTNPCNADTDGDGLLDHVDPTPTNPGATAGFLEQSARETAMDIQTLDVSAFNGPNANANQGRRNALANRATDAANAIAAGDIAGAIDALTSLLEKIDGQSPPPDWMDDSPGKTALANQVSLLISLLQLE